MSKQKNDVMAAQSGALSAPLDFGEMAGGGGDSLKPKDLTIPQIMILQSGSPQCDKAESVYHPDAAPGMLLLSARNEVRDPEVGLVFVPIRKTDHVEERTPKEGDKATKFVALHAIDSDIVKEAKARAEKDPSQAKESRKRLFTANGNMLRDCVYLWGYTLPDDKSDVPEGVSVIKITSSKFGPFRKQFANPIAALQDDTGRGDAKKGVPWWGVKIRIGTFLEKNVVSGGKYFNFKFEPVAGPGKWRESIIRPVKLEDGSYSPPYLFGAEIDKRIKSGEMKVDMVDSGVDEHADTDDSPKATAGF